eukprot:1149309-Pelagomonas_calceolata.AAC.3
MSSEQAQDYYKRKFDKLQEMMQGVNEVRPQTIPRSLKTDTQTFCAGDQTCVYGSIIAQKAVEPDLSVQQMLGLPWSREKLGFYCWVLKGKQSQLLQIKKALADKMQSMAAQQPVS